MCPSSGTKCGMKVFRAIYFFFFTVQIILNNNKIALEEASRFYFTEHNAEAMLERLAPLHQMIEKGPETLREISFQQGTCRWSVQKWWIFFFYWFFATAFGRDLQEALEWCKKYTKTQQVSASLLFLLFFFVSGKRLFTKRFSFRRTIWIKLGICTIRSSEESINFCHSSRF